MPEMVTYHLGTGQSSRLVYAALTLVEAHPVDTLQQQQLFRVVILVFFFYC